MLESDIDQKIETLEIALMQQSILGGRQATAEAITGLWELQVENIRLSPKQMDRAIRALRREGSSGKKRNRYDRRPEVTERINQLLTEMEEAQNIQTRAKRYWELADLRTKESIWLYAHESLRVRDMSLTPDASYILSAGSSEIARLVEEGGLTFSSLECKYRIVLLKAYLRSHGHTVNKENLAEASAARKSLRKQYYNGLLEHLAEALVKEWETGEASRLNKFHDPEFEDTDPVDIQTRIQFGDISQKLDALIDQEDAKAAAPYVAALVIVGAPYMAATFLFRKLPKPAQEVSTKAFDKVTIATVKGSKAIRNRRLGR